MDTQSLQAGEDDVTSPSPSPDWTFLSNHAHVLHCIFVSPEIRIRDIAVQVEITERAVQRIVLDLEHGGYLIRKRVGRQNHYQLQPGLPLRHPMERHVEVGRLLAALHPSAPAAKSSAGKRQRSAASSSRRIGVPASQLKKKPGKPAKPTGKKRA